MGWLSIPFLDCSLYCFIAVLGGLRPLRPLCDLAVASIVWKARKFFELFSLFISSNLSEGLIFLFFCLCLFCLCLNNKKRLSEIYSIWKVCCIVGWICDCWFDFIVFDWNNIFWIEFYIFLLFVNFILTFYDKFDLYFLWLKFIFNTVFNNVELFVENLLNMLKVGLVFCLVHIFTKIVKVGLITMFLGLLEMIEIGVE